MQIGDGFIRRLRIALGIALGFTLAASLYTFSLLQERSSAEDRLLHSHRAISRLADLTESIFGYVAETRSIALRDPRRAQHRHLELRAGLNSQLDMTESTFARDPAQRERLDALREALQAYNRHADELLAIARGAGVAAAIEAQRNGDGAARVARIEAQLDRLRAEEEGRLAQRELEAGEHESRLIAGAGGMVFAQVLLFMLAYVLLRRELSERARAAQEIAGREARFRATFEQAAVGLAHVSRDGVVLRANGRMAKLFGRPVDALIGCSMFELSHPDDVTATMPGRARLYAGECDSFTVEKRYLRDGEPVWMRVTLSLANEAEGEPGYEIVVFEDVNDTHRVQNDLRRFRAAMENTFDAVYLTSRRTMRIVDVNEAASRMLGYAREELVGASPRTVLADTSATDESLAREYDRFITGGEPSMLFETLHRRKDGSTVPVEVRRGTVQVDGEHYIVGVVRDLRARRDADLALRESEGRYRTLIELSPDAIFVLEGARIVFMNEAGAKLYGAHDAREMLGRSILDFVHPDFRPLVRDRIEAIRTGTGSAPRTEVVNLRTDGTPIDIEVVSARIVYNGVPALQVMARDVSERKRVQAELERLAQFDPLTSLPNRNLFQDRLDQALALAKRNDWRVGVLFVDLDRFKSVNESLGHAQGDELLKEASVRLQRCLRADETIARLGGDEFAVILPDLASVESASATATRLLEALARPVELAGRRMPVSASIGITVFPFDGADAETLLRNADVAMYRAKGAGRNTFQFFAPSMNAEVAQQLALENELREALARREFELHYQPKTDVTGQRITGLEALLRWRRPDGSLVQPAEFVPTLEETGLIAQVGDWVIGEACRQLQEWHGQGLRGLSVAVNVSARQFSGGGLLASVRRALREGGCASSQLEFEITESLVMHDVEVTVETLEALRGMGVRVAIDDFGTGYSSLAYLRRLPVDAIKIDRAFIRDVTEKANDAAIVTAIIGMARTLGFRVVAEGVETPLQRQFLEAYGCHEIQGYLLSRPLPARELAKWARAHRAAHPDGGPEAAG